MAFGSGNSFGIGPILVDPGRNILSNGTDTHALEPKIMDVLEYLASRHGEVCARDDIIGAVWKVEYGADESLTRAISVIRKTMRNAGGRGRYIQTISKRGYCLQEAVADVPVNIAPSTAIAASVPVSAPTPAPLTLAPPPLAPPPLAPKVRRGRTEDVLVSEPPATAESVARPPKRKSGILIPILALIGVFGAAMLAWQGSQSNESFGRELAISPYGRSVAVMPFVDMSVGKDRQYFSDGMAEELSNELRKIKDLRIVGQRLGGASQYGDLSYEEVGDKLRVAHIIHGSVRHQGDRVRIAAQLINTEDNAHVWSSNYDGTLDDVFELQQRVSSDIALELSLLLRLDLSEPIEIDALMPATLTLGSD